MGPGDLAPTGALGATLASSCLPTQVILIIKYWTVLSVLAIVLSLFFYVVVTWVTQSFWLFQISPKTFPFLCEPPAGGGVVGPGEGDPLCPSRSLCLLSCPRDTCRGMGGGEGMGCQEALWRLQPGLPCDPALSLDADQNVLSHPSILLVILLNVSLNTLPTLALRVIYQALKKPCPKVRAWGPCCTLLGPLSHSLCGKTEAPRHRGRWEEWRAGHTSGALGAGDTK